MNQLAPSSRHEYSLTVMSGADKGATYKLGAGRISIGRGSENAIIIKDDPKVSRQHVVLTITSKGVELTDVSDKNTLLVNGQEYTSGIIKPGDIIQLGLTKFRFDHLSADAYLDMVVPNPHLENQMQRRSQAKKERSSRKNQSSGPSMNFYILLGAILFLGYYLYTSTPGNTNTKLVSPDEKVNLEIEKQEQLTNQKMRELEDRGSKNPQWVAAQSQYVKGFRDFQKGQFDRAIESFQACVSLVPNHNLCQTYLDNAKRKHDELIQNQMEFGRKYKEQNQWAACAAAFRNVMVMVKDQSNIVFKEALTNRKFCELSAGEKY